MERSKVKSRLLCAVLCIALLAVSLFAVIFTPTKTKAEAALVDSGYKAGDPEFWDGELAAAGWTDTSETFWQDFDVDAATLTDNVYTLSGKTKTKAPDGYIVNKKAKTVTINDAASFAYFAHETNLDGNHFAGYTVNLNCDIDLAGKPWIPIAFDGTDSYFSGFNDCTTEAEVLEVLNHKVIFRGTFDGKGHTVSNFTSALLNTVGSEADGIDGLIYDADVTNAMYPTVGLVYWKAGNKKIYFTHPYVDGDFEYAFGLFSTVGNATFKNITVTGIKIDTGKEKLYNADGTKNINRKPNAHAGLIGTALGDITLENCVAGTANDQKDVDNNNTDSYVKARCSGGLVGRNYASKIFGYPYGNKAVESCSMIGQNKDVGAVKFINCVNYADVIQKANDQYSGGLIGYIQYAKTFVFDGCENYGKVSGIYTGGLVPSIKACEGSYYFDVNNPDAVPKKLIYDVKITNCTNYGDVIGCVEATSGSVDNRAGGIVGYVSLEGAFAMPRQTIAVGHKLVIDNCVNRGNIYSYGYGAGGIAGYISAGRGYHTFQYNDSGENVTSFTSHPEPTDLAVDGHPNMDYGYAYITNVFNYGDITLDYKKMGSRYKSDNYLGGLIGFINSYKPGNYSNELYAFDKRFVISGASMGKLTNNVEKYCVENSVSDDWACSTGRAVGAVWVQSTPSKYTGLYSVKYFEDTQTDIVAFTNNAYNKNETSVMWTPRASAAWEGDVDTLPDMSAYLKIENGVVKGFVSNNESLDTSKPYKIVIPASVTKIDERAFAGQDNLVCVQFAPNSALTEIADFAFIGSRLSNIAIPDKVTTIGKYAFAQLSDKFNTVDIPASVKTIGDSAFGSNDQLNAVYIYAPSAMLGNSVFGPKTLLIAQNAQGYRSLVSNISCIPYLNNLTYPVKLNYVYGNETATDYMLYGQDYKLDNESFDPAAPAGEWKIVDDKDIGYRTKYNSSAYKLYTADGALISDVDAMQSYTAPVSGDVLNIYVGDASTSTDFIAKSGLVFDDTVYRVSQLNSLLAPVSTKLDPATMTWEIASYTDPDGTAADEAALPIVVYNAGTYGIKVTSAEFSTKTFDIVIARQNIDLADLSANLPWRYVNGSKVTELRDMPGMCVYEYKGGTKAGERYVSRVPLPDSQVTALDLKAEYTTSNVVNSVIRYKGSDVKIELAGGMSAVAYATAYTDNVKSDIGRYTATAELTATNNYALTFTAGVIADINARGLDITVAEDGRTATVTKVWYIADVGNYFVDGSGNDYHIGTLSFNDVGINALRAPVLFYGSTAEANSVTFTLSRNNVGITNTNGSSTFALSAFDSVINRAMPAGNYVLTVNAPAVSVEEADEDGVPTGEITDYAAFNETFTFEVVGLDVPASVTKAVNELLLNKEFKFKYDENAHMFDDIAASVGVALTYNNSYTRTDTVWAQEDKYGSLYSSFHLEYNLVSAQSATYIDSLELVQEGKYNVLYRVVAQNYFASQEIEDNYFTFTTTIVRPIAVPTVASKVYNGSAQKPDIASVSYYTVSNDGFTDAGNHDVTLTLVDDEIYMWDGETVDGTRSATKIVTFSITKAPNDWEVKPDIVRWVEGKYNADKNIFVGKAMFGTENIVYTVTSTDGKTTYYSVADGVNKLAKLETGTYILLAEIADSVNYNGLVSKPIYFEVFKKPGLPWWAVLLIAVGSVGLVVGVFLILWKKGVFRIITDKILVAIRTRISVDSTIAAVRAQKRQEEIAASRAAAIAKEQAQENREKAKQAAAEYRALPAEQKAKQAQDKAAAALARAEKARQRAELMQAKANRMSERAAAETVATTPPATEQPAAPVDEPTTPPDTNPTDSE